jgi:LmbE family N-acetylglucosaminyl deacetylase
MDALPSAISSEVEGSEIKMKVVVLSPHRDDAAFSCGLAMRALLYSGVHLKIVNVCTMSCYAPYSPDCGNDRLEQVSQIRHGEDLVFLQRLGRDTNNFGAMPSMLDLGWLDAPVRWKVEDAAVLETREVPPTEIHALSIELERFRSSDLVLAPLALGGHVDHLLVHIAAVKTYAENRLVFYEDLPYAGRLPTAELSKLAQQRSWRFVPQPGTPGIKRDDALCYPSQIAPDVADEMEQYALTLGGSERFYGSIGALQQFETILKGQE